MRLQHRNWVNLCAGDRLVALDLVFKDTWSCVLFWVSLNTSLEPGYSILLLNYLWINELPKSKELFFVVAAFAG